MYSQNNEEEIILKYFKDFNNGKLLEIGAFHPFKFSNSRALYEKGWSMIMLEPNPICYKALSDEYSNDDRVKLLEYAITDTDGTIEFYQPGGDAIGTTDMNHKQKWEKANVKYNKITVNTMSMNTLLEKYGKDINFLNLDVEGKNLELFNLIPNDFFNSLKLICVEHDGNHKYMETKLSSLGFNKLLYNGENLIMGK